jgi:invasion protein IalB
MRIKTTFSGMVCAASLIASGVFAQDQSTNRVAQKTKWSVFVEDNPTECWSVSAPEESVNSRGGRVVAATRSQILLMVFYRPSEGAKGQVAFTGGYPFASGSTVNVNISGNEFEMFTEGEWAWPASASDDAKMVTAMKRGASAVISAVSGRGTATKDTFSLSGFTAAVEDTAKRRGG